MFGKDFTAVIQGNRSDLDSFMHRVGGGSPISDVELPVVCQGKESALRFFGSRVDDHFVIAAGTDLDDMLLLLVDRTARAEPGRDRLLQGFKRAFLLHSRLKTNEAMIFDELSRLNSEIVNTSRELSKRNFELFLEKERNRVTIASIGDAVVVTDVQGRITSMNSIAEELTCWSSRDALEMDVADVIRFLDANGDALHGSFSDSLREGKSTKLLANSILLRRDGTTIPVDDSIAPIKDSAGKTIGLIITFRDITQRKFAEEALQESEARYRSLFENMLNGAAIHEIVTDAHGVPTDYRFLELNEAFEEMTGLHRRTVLGRTVREVLPNLESKWIERYGRVVTTGMSDQFESSSQDLGRHFQVSVYRNAPRQFTTIVSDVTERKRADEESKDSRKTLADIIDFLPDATFVVDIEGRVLAWNRAIEKMTGVDKANMVGKGDHEFSIPFYGKRRPQLLDLLTLDNAENDERYDFVTRDGDTLYAETFCNALNEGRGAHVWAKATSLLDEEGKRIGAIESIRDITERKSVESSLKESEEKYRNLVLHSSDPIFNVNPDETYRFVNEAFSAPFGKKPEDIIGKTPHALFPKDEAERQMALVRQVFHSGKRGEIEVKVVTATGQERYYLTMADPIIDDAGKVLSVSCISKDITERKRVENELKQSQHLLSRILDTTPNLIYIYDLKQQRNLYSNREVAEFLGYSPLQIQEMGASLFDIIMHPEDLKVVMEQQEQLRHATEGEIALVEYRLRGADGSWHWVRSRDVIFERGPDGSILSELGIAEDITERKYAEEALRESNRKLSLLSGITRHDIVNQLVILQGHLGLLEKSKPELAHNDHVKRSAAAAASISA
ncbi:MAG: PAS domain S-box protein, partial [Methanomassiliicoccales archaeon]